MFPRQPEQTDERIDHFTTWKNSFFAFDRRVVMTHRQSNLLEKLIRVQNPGKVIWTMAFSS